MKSKLILIGLTLFMHSTYATGDFDKLIKDFDSFDKEVTPFLKSLDKHVKRDVYDILDNYENDDSELVKKWFNIASQITTNQELEFFIKNTDYKIRAIIEKLIFDKMKPITAEDRKVLLEKFDFLSSQVKDKLVPLNIDGKAKVKVYFRTMPIVSNLTKKRKSDNQFILLTPKTSLTLLYKITYTVNGYNVVWGYVENKSDNRRGWVNLKNTTFLEKI